MPAGNPAGYYDVPGLPYPGRPGIPQPRIPAVDPNDLLATAAAEQSGAAVPGTMSGAPGARPMMGDPSVIRLAPSRTMPFSRADAQALAALDPRALQEAQAVAAVDQPKTMTATFGGQKYEMTPSARVDRNVLARLYAQAQERKGQERQDAVRGQEQAGRERLVSIPGQEATKRRELELGAEERIAGKKLEAEAPERAARIASTQAQTAATSGAEQRAAAEAARRPTPQQEAIDAALAQAEASPFAQTPEGRKRIAALYRQSTAGKALPPEEAALAAEGAAGPGPDIGTAAAEVMADPGISALIERAKQSEPGMFTGSRGRQTSAAARRLAESAVRARLQRAGVSQEEADALITSILGPSAGDKTGVGVSSLAGLLPPMLQAPARLGGAAVSAAQ